MVSSTGGALGDRALRASRCGHVMRQCARSARERAEGVETGGETDGACTVTRWLRCQRSRLGEADSGTNPPTGWDEG